MMLKPFVKPTSRLPNSFTTCSSPFPSPSPPPSHIATTAHPSRSAIHSCSSASLHASLPLSPRCRSRLKRLHPCASSNAPSSSSDDAVNKLAAKLDQLVSQAQAKAVRATQPYPLATSFLVIFCVANFLTKHHLMPAVASLDFNTMLNTLVPAAFSSHTPREFASIGLSDVTVKTFMPGAWLALIASFTHINLFHLWVTTSMIKDLGEALEPQVGTLRTIGIYIIAAAFTCWASVTYSGSALLGASGAVSGLLGALLIEVLFKPGVIGGAALNKLWGTGIWLLILGFSLRVTDPRVYLWGLGSGAAASLVFGLLPVFVRPVLTVLTAASGFCMLAVMGIALLRKVNLV